MAKGVVFRVVLCMAFMCLSVQASSILVGDPPTLGTGNCDPFGCPSFFGLGTFQEVYSSSAFSTTGEITINELTLFDFQVHNGGVPSGDTFTLGLSYTSKAPGSLDLTDPNNNITSGSQTFFSGLLPSLVTVPAGHELNISGTPFDYNPADGNLLLTVTMTGPTNGQPPLYLDFAACGPLTSCPTGSSVLTSSAYFGTMNGGNNIGGLITQFTYGSTTATPEPSSLLLVLAGVGLIGYNWRRRSTSSVR